MHFAVAGREHEPAFNRVRDYADATGGLTAGLRVSKVRGWARTPRSSPDTLRSSTSGRTTP
jgi:hypothetical protein